jgi:hypothetical protein
MAEHFDFFEKVQSMNEDTLIEEMQNLNKKLFSIRKEGGIRQQVENMLGIVQDRYNTLIALKRLEADKTPDVLNIGEIEEVVTTPDYNKEELITYFSHFYSGDKISSKQKLEKPVTGTAKTTPPIITPADRPIKTGGLGDIPVFGSKK